MLQVITTDLSDDLIRLSAYDMLVRLDIHSLPVDPLPLFDIEPSIHYNSVQNLSIYNHISVDEMITPGSAGILYRNRHGKDYIYINEDYQCPQKLWNIALAIGALELDAVPYQTYVDIPQDNSSVTAFAYYFLAPDVILDACHMHSQSKIFEYCRIPFVESHRKARKMRFRLIHKKSIGAEKTILENFHDYIEKIKIITG